MSYQLVAAKARSKGLDAVWSDVDITAMTIGALFFNYHNVWLTLSHSASAQPLYLELSRVRDQVASQYHMYTVPQWLTAIEDASLPTVSALPQFGLRKVRTTDVWRAGYDVKPFSRTRHDDAELPHGDKNDLLISREDVDFQVYHRFALVSVNGYFHRTGGSPRGLQVVDGGRSGRIANNNQLSLHSFNGVGKLDLIPITPNMIYKVVDDEPLANHAYLELPYDTEEKVVLLVIGGYLHVMDEAYTRISGRGLRINLNRIPLVERYLESLDYIDLSSLPLTRDEDNPKHVSIPELHSDPVIKAYLSLSQSFVVVVDAKNFYVRRHSVPNAQLPGRYEAPLGTESFPLFGAYGRLYDYVGFNDWGVRILACQENQRRRYMFRTTNWRGNATLDDSLETYRPWEWAHAYLLEMGRSL